MQETIEFDRVIAGLEKVWPRIPPQAGTIAVNFFKERFIAQNWIGERTEPWRRRKSKRWGNKESQRRSQRATLTDTGRLRRSIRKIKVTNDYVLIGTDVPYAHAHNEGFRGEVKQTVGEYERRKTKLGIVRRRQNKRSSRIEFGRVDTGDKINVKEHTRTIRQRIPRRQFMGASPYLNQRIERMMISEVAKGLQ